MATLTEHDNHVRLDDLDAQLAAMAQRADEENKPRYAMAGWGSLVVQRELVMDALRTLPSA